MAEGPGEDDATLVRRIAEEQDQSALAELMKRHAPKITGDLQRRFRSMLDESDIDDAVNQAAMKVWKNAGRFNSSMPFGPWFLAIARHAAQDILKGEMRRPRTYELALDLADPQLEERDDSRKLSPQMTRRVILLRHIIEHELKGFEQAVAHADLAQGGRPDWWPGAA